MSACCKAGASTQPRSGTRGASRRSRQECPSPPQGTGRRGQAGARRTRWRRGESRPAPQDEARPARRCSSSFMIRARTVSQGTVRTRPAAKSRDLLSSSPAHAAATSSSGSSRLTNNSSATRTRSWRGRRRTSASNSSVDTDPSVPPGSGLSVRTHQAMLLALLADLTHLNIHHRDYTRIPPLRRSCTARVVRRRRLPGARPPRAPHGKGRRDWDHSTEPPPSARGPAAYPSPADRGLSIRGHRIFPRQ